MMKINRFDSLNCLNESSKVKDYWIISGKEFKQQYLRTLSNTLEKFTPSKQALNSSMFSESPFLREAFGKAQYFCTTSDESEYWRNYAEFVSKEPDFFNLSDAARILIIEDARDFHPEEVKQIASTEKADGAFSEDRMEPTGLAIYNLQVLQKVDGAHYEDESQDEIDKLVKASLRNKEIPPREIKSQDLSKDELTNQIIDAWQKGDKKRVEYLQSLVKNENKSSRILKFKNFYKN